MPEVICPSWADLSEVVAGATARLTIVTPFYSPEGINRVFDLLSDSTFVSVTTRLSPPDWAARVADPESLYSLLDLLGSRQELRVLQRLHAKAYAADRNLALIGSANLSEGGFLRNVELMVRFRGGEADAALGSVEATVGPGAKPMAVLELGRWLRDSLPAIEAARLKEIDAAEDLAPAQAELDRLLGYGNAPSGLRAPDVGELADFIGWLRTRPLLPGAEMTLERHDNKPGQNLQGHVKQNYFATLRFLSEHPEYRGRLSAALNRLAQDDIYQLDPDIHHAWIDHFNDHATDAGDGWAYPILRGQLPPSVGGTLQSGGGGISTFKRMLPLVARLLTERGDA